MILGGEQMLGDFRVLVINPKSQATIVSMFQNQVCVFKRETHHTSTFTVGSNIMPQEVMNRRDVILSLLSDAGINLSTIDAICANGGILRQVEGGTYRVNDIMLADLKTNFNGIHASNMGGIIAYEIASGLNIPAFIVDPPVVDELQQIARYSGLPSVERKSIFHALNQKYVARKAANEMNKTYEDSNLIVAHIGQGISIAAHQHGKVIDVNNGLHGDGPFSIERAGTIPSEGLIKLCFTGDYTEEEVINKITFEGGLKAYLHMDNLTDIGESTFSGNTHAKEMIEVMAYQICKEIGAMATVLSGHVDGIVLTGDLAISKILTNDIIERIKWIADVYIYPGEFDNQALNEGVLRVLNGKEQVKEYLANEIWEERDRHVN